MDDNDRQWPPAGIDTPAVSGGEAAVHPVTAIPDGERQLVAIRLQEAVGSGSLALQEFIQRLDLAYAATSRAELATAIDDLPAAPPVGRGRRTRWLVNVFGDERRSGAWTPDSRVTAVNIFGDVVVDLRSAHVDSEELVVRSWCLFGDVEVIIPEGVEVELSGFCLFGDRSIDVAPVPRIQGTPRVRLVAFGLFGDATVRTDAKPRKLWQHLSRRPHTGTDGR